MAKCEHCSNAIRVLRIPEVQKRATEAVENGELDPGYAALIFGSLIQIDDLQIDPHQHQHSDFHHWVCKQLEEDDEYNFAENAQAVVEQLIQLYPPKS